MSIVPDLSNAMNSANSFNRADGTGGPRIPMLFTCTAWINAGMAPIALRINPHNVTFKQGKRITKRNTSGGTAYTHWADENGQNNDVLEISFKGRTGNINLRRDPTARKTVVGQAMQDFANLLSGTQDAASVSTNQGGAKLFTWSRLYQLTRTAVVDPSTSKKNIFYIVYRSPLFPRPILFMGFYNNVLDFGETAEAPFLVEWSFNFVVQATMPDLDRLSEYLAKVLTDRALVAKEIDTSINSAAAYVTQTAQVDFKNG